jgi:predicted nucleic acid-binding protein
MLLVLDASVTAAWAFPDETSLIADRAYDILETDNAIMPGVWWFETRNTLVIGERRGRCTVAQTEQALRVLARLPITIDRTPNDSMLFAIARRHRLTFYDASYVELALRTGGRLATLDRTMIEAANAEGVSVLLPD